MENIRKSLVQVIVCLKKNPKVFELQLFFPNSLKHLVRKARSRNSGRNCGHIIRCASLLKGPICIPQRHRRKSSVLSRLSTLICSYSSQQRSSVGDSSLKCSAIIFNAQARHLNLLLPQGSSSSALLYYQATKNARSRLNTLTKSVGLVELFLGDL